jgi:hypothetical protein
MSGMARADLILSLQGLLQDALSSFEEPEEALTRHLDAALLDLARTRPRLRRAELSLVADQSNYSAPADFVHFHRLLWGADCAAQPWDPHHPGRLPRVATAQGLAGLELILTPAPSAKQIGLLGAVCPYQYAASYAIGEQAAATTVRASDRDLLLLRAAAEGLQEIALNQANKPVRLGDGFGSMPRNGTAAALSEQLLRRYRERLR